MLAMLLLVSVMSACMPSQRQLAMERDMAEMKRRLAAVEKQTIGMGDDFTSAIEEQLSELSRRHAETQAGLDSLRVDMQSLRGRIEDMRAANSQFQEEMALIREDLSVKVAAIENRLAEIERSALETESGGGQAQPEAPNGGTATSDPVELYEQGRDLVREDERFTEARETLQKFIDAHPDHRLSVNAAYWIGEAYYGEEKYENAILQFQDIIQEHPDHNKVPAALLKQGLAFRALGDASNARVILEKVVADHPNSNAAGKAKDLLDAM